LILFTRHRLYVQYGAFRVITTCVITKIILSYEHLCLVILQFALHSIVGLQAAVHLMSSCVLSQISMSVQ